MDEPMVIERGFITERMTDQEIDSFNDAVELYLWKEYCEYDCIVATEIPPSFWLVIWNYCKALAEYYDKEDGEDAEQDH